MTEKGPDSQFISQVHNALSHLFDMAHLQRHPLTELLVGPEVSDPKLRAQALREAILQAIADLRPPPHESPHDAAYRPYAILRQKYAEGFSNEVIQDRLAISRRQFFREQHRACEAVAELLWQRRLEGDAAGGAAERALGAELAELGVQAQAFDLRQTVQQAIAAVRSLADSRAVALSMAGDQAPRAFADETITRQIVVGLLSALVQLSPRSYLEVCVKAQDRSVALSVTGLRPGLSLIAAGERLSLPMRLAAQVGGQVEVGDEGGELRVCLRLPSAREEHVVVIDDNPKALRLFRRYLEPHRFRLTLVQESRGALEQIRELRPDAVLLDVMMREVDGWQILQSLKTDPGTRDIPVIVCSVLNEAELAHILGADAYLRKPVSQSELVLALRQAGRS